ncbi:Mu transposase C-terminal domain-containing protein [Pseudocitrobacter faecalis]|uniref:Mu transposase C-terminal domain-containing protein n=1 Tax=Pseudocitrobacter faecalis TaxID=1398493 RepID=UPI0040635491
MERVGVPAVVTRPTAFLVDFLPVIRRTLTRTGFVIDHIHYYADALKPWIARRERLPAFLIRRDPRDISRIWVLEPEGQHYLEIHYRTLSHPAVTLWEQRRAGQIASARARAGGRVGAVPHDRADARDRDHRPEGHAQGAARR